MTTQQLSPVQECLPPFSQQWSDLSQLVDIIEDHQLFNNSDRNSEDLCRFEAWLDLSGFFLTII